MEMAMRMQSHGYKIKNCHAAFVYTIAPKKFSRLFTQRLRWTYGFLKNAIDYRHLFFNKKYGNLGLFILPLMIFSAVSCLWLTGSFIYNIISEARNSFLNWQAINFYLNPSKLLHFNFEWFYLNTSALAFVSISSMILMVTFVLMGRKLSEGNYKFKVEIIYFFLVYPFIAPTWLVKSIYNVLVSKKTVWR